MTRYFNDSPIETAADDEYGISPFAESLAKSILNIRAPIGTTIALHGPWGSGKSSVVNLVRAELEKARDENLVVSDFKCWWFRGEEALALAFLQNLHALVADALPDKLKGLVPKLGRGLLQAGPVIGAAVSISSIGFLGPLAGASTNFAKRFFGDEETLEDVFLKLAKALEEQNRRFLLIIDDINLYDFQRISAAYHADLQWARADSLKSIPSVFIRSDGQNLFSSVNPSSR